MRGITDDETFAELVLMARRIPQPESLERFVRMARKTGAWDAAAHNAELQLQLMRAP
jgi:hypothetical protein